MAAKNKQKKQKRIKRLQIEAEEQQQLIEQNREVAVQHTRRVKAKLDRRSNKKKGKIHVTEQKIGNTVALLSQKNLTTVVKSKIRSVFEAWRNIASR